MNKPISEMSIKELEAAINDKRMTAYELPIKEFMDNLEENKKNFDMGIIYPDQFWNNIKESMTVFDSMIKTNLEKLEG